MRAGMTIPRHNRAPVKAAVRLILMAGLLASACVGQPAVAQDFQGKDAAGKVAPAAVQPSPVIVPGFWDPRRRPERPDLSKVPTIRFLTDVDYPPFDYAGADGNPAGFNVDLARLLCDEIKAACTIQARRFDTLLDALSDKIGRAHV